MERLGYIPFVILVVIGFVLLGSKPASIALESIDCIYKNRPINNVNTNIQYVLTVRNDHNNGISREFGDTLFWEITDSYGKTNAMYALSPVYTFIETGKYIIDTYYIVDSYKPNGRLLATDSITVGETEYLAFELAADVLIEGDDEIAYNKSTFKNRTREWVIENSEGEEQLRDSSSDTLVMDLKPGGYFVVLQLYNDIDTIEEKKGFTVKEFVAANPVVKPTPKPKPKPKQAKPVLVPTSEPISKREPARIETPVDGWYTAVGNSGKFELGPAIPKRKKANFSGGTTIITLMPKTDIQLSEFSYFGNYNTGNYQIEYECMSCENQNQKRLSFSYATANDEYNNITKRMTANRIGFLAGHTYKITVTTLNQTEMQFEKLDRTNYDNENVSIEFMTDRSSIFGLTFLKR